MALEKVNVFIFFFFSVHVLYTVSVIVLEVQLSKYTNATMFLSLPDPCDHYNNDFYMCISFLKPYIFVTLFPRNCVACNNKCFKSNVLLLKHF